MSICNLSTTQIVFFRTVWNPTALAVSGCQEIKLDLSCKTNDENLFYKVTDIDEVSDIKSYMLTRRTNKYKVYLPNETELIKYNKKIKIKIKNNTYNTQSFIFANNCFIYNCDEEDVVILNESNFKLV